MADAATSSVQAGGRGFPPAAAYRAIKLVVFDVDGVLTDGRIVWDSNGVETKFFHVRDGAAFVILNYAGMLTGIISGRSSKVVDIRAAELKIPPERVKQGAKVKLPVFEDMAAAAGLTVAETAFVGDDLIDVPVLERAGFAACPADAHTDVKQYCHAVSSSRGGRGGVREIVEHLLKQRQDDVWQQAAGRFMGKVAQ